MKKHILFVALAVALSVTVSVAGDRALDVKVALDTTDSLLVVTEDGVKHTIDRALKIPAEGPLGVVIVDGTGGDAEGLGDELAIGFLSTAERDMRGVTRVTETLVSELLADGEPTVTAAIAASARGGDLAHLEQAGPVQDSQHVSATWNGKTFRKTCPAGCSWPEDFECCEIYGCSGPYTDCIEIVLHIQQR